MSNPLVSVIIPTYNRVGFLSRSLASVINQTYTNIELIVIDDGSVDGTEEFVTNLADGRIRYIRLQKNGGQANARNVGMEAAKGQYIAFLDSDDVWALQCLEYQMHALTSSTDNNAGGTLCHSQLSVSVPRPDDPRLAYMWFLHWKHPIQIGSLVMRKECVESIGGFNTKLIAYEDWEFMLRFSKRYQLIYHPAVLAYVDEHKGPRVTKPENHIAALHTLLDMYAEELVDRPDVLALWRYRLASQYRVMGDMQSSRRQISESLRLWPWSARRWFMLILHLLPGHELQRKATQLYRKLALAGSKLQFVRAA